MTKNNYLCFTVKSVTSLNIFFICICLCLQKESIAFTRIDTMNLAYVFIPHHWSAYQIPHNILSTQIYNPERAFSTIFVFSIVATIIYSQEETYVLDRPKRKALSSHKI